MLRQKRAREKGKIKPSHLVKTLKEGDPVVLIRDLSSRGMFPKQFQGKIARVVGRQGNAYTVRFLNGRVFKTLTLNPAHLKKFG
ncbi:MAG: 50S ribosomal protein L21e [Candidatus Pacearchaeota archaeon]